MSDLFGILLELAIVLMVAAFWGFILFCILAAAALFASPLVLTIYWLWS